MTTTIIIVAVYLVGCVLAYGRLMAMSYEVDEVLINKLEPSNMFKDSYRDYNFWVMILFSWYSLISGIGFKIKYNQKYLFKWSKKELWKQYYENQK